MGLKNMSLLSGGTVATTGGTALVFAEDGVSIQNGLHLMVPADADYQTRRQLTIKYRPPTLNPKTGSYGKDKKTLTYAQPQVLATGEVVFNILRIEKEVHPALPAASALDLCVVGAQLLTDADVVAFLATGALS